MTYDQLLIADGLCPEVVMTATEDGPETGRCRQPIEPDGFACPGHAAEIRGWLAMSEPERAAWERRHYEETGR